MQFKSLVNLTVDSPLADGRLTTWGIARDWPAAEPKEGHPNYTPDLGGAYGWDYKGHFEYIKPLKAIAPTATTPRTAMIIGNWTVVRGLWRETSAAGTLKAAFLHYYDGWPNRYAAGDWGVIQSNANYTPDLLFYLRRYPADAADTDPPVVAIFFLGDGILPQYGIILPALGLGGDFWTGLTGNATAQLKHPILVGMPRDLASDPAYDACVAGCAATRTAAIAACNATYATCLAGCAGNPACEAACVDTRDTCIAAADAAYDACVVACGDEPAASSKWTIIDEFRGGGAPQQTQAEEEDYRAQVLKVEYTDGWMLVNFSGSAQTWAYTGNWIDANARQVEFFLPPGPIRVEVVGHTASFLMAQLTYPTDVDLDAHTALHAADPPFQQTVNYDLIDATPAGTAIAAAEHPDSGAGVSKPRLNFTGPGTARAVFYNLQEFRNPVIGAASSAPVSSVGNDQLRVREASGSLNDRWRGATATVVVQAKVGNVLPALPPNSKVTIDIGLKESAALPPGYIQHTGYILPPEFEKTPPEQVSATIHCADGVEARLQHKTMKWMCSFEEQPVDGAFKYILNCAGIPNSMISIDAAITPAAMGDAYYLPVNDPKGERLLKFRPDHAVISALDTIVEVRDLDWGIDQNGDYFLRPRLVHTPGAFDWTLKDDTAVEDDIIYSFRAARSLDDFANVIYVLAGSGWTASASLLWDFLSITDPTAADFIGDDWWKVELVPDGDDAAELAARLWAQRSRLAHMIFWTNRAYPNLMPDHYVRVQSTNMAVPNNTIFKITRKAWRCARGGSDFAQDFEGVIVEEP